MVRRNAVKVEVLPRLRRRRLTSPNIVSALLLAVPPVWLGVAAYQRRWTSDDAFITLRVVRNLLDGFGPVFNPFERVEAYTHPLWLAVIAVCGLFTPELEVVAAALGLFLGVGAIAIATLASVNFHAKPGTMWVPLGVLAFASLPPAWDFTTSGLELSLVFAWIGASAALLQRAQQRPESVSLTLFVIGLGVLIVQISHCLSLPWLRQLSYSTGLGSDSTGQPQRLP